MTSATLTSNSASVTAGGIGIDQDHITTLFTYDEIAAGTQDGFPADIALAAPVGGQAAI